MAKPEKELPKSAAEHAKATFLILKYYFTVLPTNFASGVLAALTGLGVDPITRSERFGTAIISDFVAQFALRTANKKFPPESRLAAISREAKLKGSFSLAGETIRAWADQRFLDGPNDPNFWLVGLPALFLTRFALSQVEPKFPDQAKFFKWTKLATDMALILGIGALAIEPFTQFDFAVVIPLVLMELAAIHQLITDVRNPNNSRPSKPSLQPPTLAHRLPQTRTNRPL